MASEEKASRAPGARAKDPRPGCSGYKRLEKTALWALLLNPPTRIGLNPTTK